jgi:hypothetical protein
VAQDDADRGALAAQPEATAPLSRLAVRRHDPRWEPGALAAHAGICAGAASDRRRYSDAAISMTYIIHCGESALADAVPTSATSGDAARKAIFVPGSEQGRNTDFLVGRGRRRRHEPVFCPCIH